MGDSNGLHNAATNAVPRRRCLVVMFIFALAAGITTAVFICREKEPVHNGRSLSEWLLLLTPPSGPPDPGDRQQAVYSLSEMGTNSLPFLVEWIQYEIPGWRKGLNPSLSKLPTSAIQLSRDTSLIRAEAAARAFEILGSEASPAVPRLSSILNSQRSPWVQQRCIVALASIGEDGLPPLIAAFGNPKAPRYQIAAAFRTMHKAGVDVSEAVPALLLCLRSSDASTAFQVQDVLHSLSQTSNVFMRALTNCLEDTDRVVRLSAAERLASLENRAIPAVPALFSALDDPDPDVRTAVTNALRTIAPEILR